jgi:pimeloyl-ACP methyl ester carboxylesterase
MDRWLYVALAGSALALGLTLAGAGCALPRAGKSFAELDWALPVKTVDVDGIRVAYHEAGQGGPGPEVLLVHGLGSNMLVWTRVVGALSGTHRVVAIDLPGYGQSQKASYQYSMAFFARVVDRVIDRLGMRRPVIVGHSMGGQIAVTHALMFPGRASALVLAAPAGFEEFEPGEASWMAEVVSKEFLKATLPDAAYANLANNFSGDVPREALFMWRHRVQIIDGPEFDDYAYANARSIVAMLRGPVAKRLSELDLPVLVVFGEDDRLIPNPALHGGNTRDVAEAGARKLKRAHLMMLKRTGHLLQLESPGPFLACVMDFLNREVHP